MSGKYDDIIDLPHHVSLFHPRMSQHDRAAQFSPFAALTGYEDVIRESERLTSTRREMDEQGRSIVDQNLRQISESVKDCPAVVTEYYAPDMYKDGGSYRMHTGIVKKIDFYAQKLIYADGTEIDFHNIWKTEIMTDSVERI